MILFSNLLLVSFFLFSSCCFADEDFYIFDVGQGSCNFIVYKKNKIGMLFDAGSKNTKTLRKISFFQDEEEPVAIFAEQKKYSKKEETKQSKDTSFLLEEMAKVLQQEKTPVKPSKKSMSFEESMRKKSRVADIQEKIKKTIKDYNLDILFIFLSHPDEDHINLIPKVIPEDINKIEAFLGGDWVNHETEDTKEALTYLKKRGAAINFPYYWKYEGSLFPGSNMDEFKYTTGKNKYLQLKKMILTDVSMAKKVLSLNNFPMYTSEKLINTYFSSSPTMWDIGKVLYVNNHQDDENYKKTQSEDLKNVYFRSFGAETAIVTENDKDVVNAQSLIISFVLPSLKAVVTCTGDAESETFTTVKAMSSGFYNNTDNYLKALVIPHHGAIKNFSGNIITTLKPDLFFVSAGLTSYDHPNMYALEAYEKLNTSQFSEKYMRTEDHLPLCMSIGRQDKTGLGYKMILFKGTAVLSTNLLGDISWRNSKIYSSYSNIIDYKDKKYLVDTSFSLHKLYKKLSEEQLKGLLLEEEKDNLDLCNAIIKDFQNKKSLILSQITDYPVILNVDNKSFSNFSYAVFLNSQKEYRLYKVTPVY